VLLTTLLQFGESAATFFCKQANAAGPPGETPEQRDMKSDRQAAFIALCWAAVTFGAGAGAAAGAGLAVATGFATGLGAGWLAVAFGGAGGGAAIAGVAGAAAGATVA
jgi:hypothetical protein